MTDARLPGRWLLDPRFDRLTDVAYRTHHNSLMYAAEHGTDGAIERRALRFLHPEGFQQAAADELVAAGLWEPTDDGYLVARWSESQSTDEQVRANRERKRLNQASKRARDRSSRETSLQSQTGPVTSDVGGDVTGDVGAHVGEERQGQDRPGQEELEPRVRTRDEQPLSAMVTVASALPPRQHAATRGSSRSRDDEQPADLTARRNVVRALGISDVDDVMDHLREMTERSISDDTALAILRNIVRKAPGRITEPDTYTRDYITANADDLRDDIDNAALAASVA